MKISHFIFLGFLFILSIFSITTYINFKLTEAVEDNTAWVARSTTVVRYTNRFQRNLQSMVNGLRSYLLTGDAIFRATYDSAVVENGIILDELHTYMIPGSIQTRALQDIEDLHEQWMKQYASPAIAARQRVDEVEDGGESWRNLHTQLSLYGPGDQINRQLQQKFRDFADYEYELREVRKTSLERSATRTRNISIYLTTVSIVAGLAVAAYLSIRISGRIQKMVSTAHQITGGQYHVMMDEHRHDELGQLAHALNHMAHALSENIVLLKRKNEELDQFAHIVSHDLKAPLRGIGNVMTWIEEDHTPELSPKVREYIALIKGRLYRAENLIRGLLIYARAGKTAQNYEDVDLNEMLNEIQEGIALRPELKILIPTHLPRIRTERIPLQQILSNLIINAVKYHDKKQGYIKVYLAEKPAHYEFYVEDNGPGIAPQYHDKIFLIFQTLVERDSFESTGIGLAIVKKILDERKQRIRVTSSPGNGSIFSFTWPKY